jgi:Domain of unknown function (DUF4386)
LRDGKKFLAPQGKENHMSAISTQVIHQTQPHSETAPHAAGDAHWSWLYRIGAAGALFAVVLIPIQLFVFTSTPEPTTAAGWFSLFQDNALLGLLSFEVLFVINAVFGVATTLALYIALRRVNESWMMMALALNVIGSVMIIVARPALDMLYLSDLHAAATADPERAMLLAAGTAVMSMRHGTAFHLSYNLANIVLIIIPLVMLQTNVFSRLTAYMGLLAGVIGFGLYLPTIGIFVSVVSVLFYVVWYLLVALRLYKLANNRSVAAS